VDAQSARPQPIAVSSDPGPSSADTPGNIDKVREILFGGQMREYERRFARLEERLLQETAGLRDEVRRRLTAVEQFATGEAASLAERLAGERDERADADRDLAHEMREAAKAVERKSGQLDDRLGRIHSELRQQMLELQQRMTDEMRDRINEVLARLGQEATGLRADKADRATLAALLTEMAMRLTNDLSIPGLDDGRHE
jgi:hypothetical protein